MFHTASLDGVLTGHALMEHEVTGLVLLVWSSSRALPAVLLPLSTCFAVEF